MRTAIASREQKREEEKENGLPKEAEIQGQTGRSGVHRPDGWKNPSEQLVERRIIPGPPKTAKLNQIHPIHGVGFALIFRNSLGTTHPSTYEVAGRNLIVPSPTECPACGTGGHLGKLENEENRTVKRTVGILAGMATLGIGVYLGSQVWAQQRGTAVSSEPLKTKIATVNLTQVLKNYKKFKGFQDEIKGRLEAAKKEFEPLSANLVRLQEKARAASPTEADQIKREYTKKAQELQDKEEDIRKAISAREGEISVQIFKEVETAVNLFATHNAIELVLYYNDASKDDPANYYNPINVQRKLTSGPMLPMYIDPRMDITNMVTEMLNPRPQANASPGSSR
jgi:Skp family chaperone for outer membrane proteins